MQVVETVFDKNIVRRGDSVFYDGIKLAYYNGKLIIKDGYLTKSNPK